VGWLILAIYDLDVVASLLVLLITATVSSIMNRRVNHIDG